MGGAAPARTAGGRQRLYADVRAPVTSCAPGFWNGEDLEVETGSGESATTGWGMATGPCPALLKPFRDVSFLIA